ncbi:hypothetical protein AVEN_194448-1 [Araneus ventricosus]|uniref:Uncharacterized protein n=1 Tax=Araneus ventricosus TaxID=182803 RepID=A0A4Y2A5R8_ARAVE|nr:hypothetical protein AVEN_194448-1 [Araneus ventricosus]
MKQAKRDCIIEFLREYNTIMDEIKNDLKDKKLDIKLAKILKSNGELTRLTGRGHDLGNSVRDETWHISSIPLGCSPINLIKCNGQPIRRKWPSNFGHTLYASNQQLAAE